jgi:Protein of unknown function (DUF3465)
LKLTTLDTKLNTKLNTILGTALLLTLLQLQGCNGQTTERFQPQRAPNASQSPDQGQTEVLAAQAEQAPKVEVTVTARVLKMLPEDTRGLPHELFLLRLNNGTTVKVAHDTKAAPRVPLQEGDLVRIHGEYIWNPKGGVIHWTHRNFGGRHEPGWIDFNGQRYQ